MAQKNTNEQLEKPDLQIVQMIKTLDDFIQISNLLSERLSSWSDFSPSVEKLKPLNLTYTSVNTEIENIQKQIGKDMLSELFSHTFIGSRSGYQETGGC